MKLISFGAASIQKGRRIAIADNLLQNLGIKEGDLVELFLNTKEKAIVVKKSQNAYSEVKLGRAKKQRSIKLKT